MQDKQPTYKRTAARTSFVPHVSGSVPLDDFVGKVTNQASHAKSAVHRACAGVAANHARHVEDLMRSFLNNTVVIQKLVGSAKA